MKLSDYIADFFAQQGIKYVFAVTGGASIHIIHSLDAHPDTDFIAPHHEQAGAMAADAYARTTGGLGAAVATSGPGATNLLTGICCSWFDSVPVLYVTGQVATFRFRGDTGVRQMGFQETQIVDIVRSVTKYAALITDPYQARYELEKAVHIAQEGRPGPVLIDIPDDLQRAEVDPDAMKGYNPPKSSVSLTRNEDQVIDRVVSLMQSAQRPVLIPGWGIRLAKAEPEFRRLADILGYPVCPSWGAMDLLPHDHPDFVGGFGTHGSRYGNFAVQNSDLVLAVGARMSTRETGSPIGAWARDARTIIVDIDASELGKFPSMGKPLDIAVHSGAKEFLGRLLNRLEGYQPPDISEWKGRVAGWKADYPALMPAYRDEEAVNPYVFVDALAEHALPDEHFYSDTGCAIAWMMQGFAFRGNQRAFHAFNNTPMGYALPAAIGGSFALDKAPVSCLAGDGSIMMNMQELATVRYHNLPIRIFIINNDGYSMVRQTQEQWLNGEFVASSREGGPGFPDFCALAESFGIPSMVLDQNADIQESVLSVMQHNGPILCDVRIPADHRVIPQSRFGRPIEDADPLLPRDEFKNNMIVAPLESSLVPNPVD